MDQPIRKNFASDNVVSVSPSIMDAMLAANTGTAPSYGADPLSCQLDAAFSTVFGTDVVVLPVGTGTAANALALAALTPPYGVVLCETGAHINTDEGGAGEFFTHGAKLVGIASGDGRITPDGLRNRLARPGVRIEYSPLHALSLTQATEWGTVYDVSTVQALGGLAREAGLRIHMDGARFANAVAHLGCAPADVTWKAGVDVLSFGATKNGAMAAEAIVFFDPALARDSRLRLKRGGHQWSKHRFLAAQLLAYLNDDLWLRNARQANAAATRLAAGLAALPDVSLPLPTQANEVFAIVPPGLADGLKAAGFLFYPWDAPAGEANPMIRLVTSFDMTDADVDGFLTVARGLVAA
ncbi:low-specificity threonine aldolase [Ameyamaea chiangmaiensis NBRC 103196]|uniref:L-threonine aldolase n=1 Tax=Ameyamaea chiangmaiensis TaxID=442969 RepID=A0A850PB43_9PROT|nr:beta-eliminating lyase-related protein [Ameyamaea chiangmaiensis]MBS4075714.1 low specificity L-threonine aldolase [Ameyamaea chiangmaiensis]NVN41168.1 low specificity L-threonine aldolase [Ameyamaea chiangmaiensis]GBQ70408.1 low-specificity threonine aldolase [Ameyamaea chiangmaiensis NBRC 103196]